MMVVKKGFRINLAIKQDSANITNYGVKTIPLGSNILHISHQSKVTYHIARVENKTVFPMHIFSLFSKRVSFTTKMYITAHFGLGKSF